MVTMLRHYEISANRAMIRVPMISICREANIPPSTPSPFPQREPEGPPSEICPRVIVCSDRLFADYPFALGHAVLRPARPPPGHYEAVGRVSQQDHVQRLVASCTALMERADHNGCPIAAHVYRSMPCLHSDQPTLRFRSYSCLTDFQVLICLESLTTPSETPLQLIRRSSLL